MAMLNNQMVAANPRGFPGPFASCPASRLRQEVVLIARDTWHDYLGYTLETSCHLELVGWSVAECKSYAENNAFPR